MRYAKPPLTYDKQLEVLVDRGLNCPDQDRALQWLKRIGYYRLSAYFIPFWQVGADRFRDGISINDFIDPYKFDGGLRLLTMQAVDRIEIGTRAVITYHLAHDLGPFGYAD